MRALLFEADQVLRGRPAADRPGVLVARRAALAVFCGLLYGAVMGTFGGLAGDRAWQVVFSATKLPLLLAVVFLLSLPSFLVLNTLLGARNDLPDVLRALVSSQAGLTLILAALAPYTALWYASTTDYRQALLFNGGMFAVASAAAQLLLRRAYRPLVARNPAHRWLLRVWLVLYMFVGIQMAWVLRPFIGDPDLPVRFFRPGAWGNAYVIVAGLVRDAVAEHVGPGERPPAPDTY
jgi:hypothetical protein